ncbi:DUF3592 domain-containing protein [Streptomyces sp. PmtG]
MGVLFNLAYIVPALMACMAIAGVVTILRRSAWLWRAWRSGVTAEARCLRTYTTTSSHGGDSHRVSTNLHHVYEFVTRDGRVVRFEEENGPGTVLEGDIVTVYYAPERPDRATAHAPRPLADATATIFMLCFLGVVIAFCVFFVMGAMAFQDGFGWGLEDDPGGEVPGDEVWEESD